VPPFAGALEYRRPGSDPIVISLLQGFVPNQGDAWTSISDIVSRYFEQILSQKAETQGIPQLPARLVGLDSSDIPPLILELIGGFSLEMASLLGERTGELHLALASIQTDPNFAAEPFSLLYQRSVYQSMRSLTRRVFQSLGKNLKKLPDNVRGEAEAILSSEQEVLQRLRKILQRKISVVKIRTHSDYHLGQVLSTGKDFVIIDFKGEPARAFSERRLKVHGRSNYRRCRPSRPDRRRRKKGWRDNFRRPRCHNSNR